MTPINAKMQVPSMPRRAASAFFGIPRIIMPESVSASPRAEFSSTNHLIVHEILNWGASLGRFRTVLSNRYMCVPGGAVWVHRLSLYFSDDHALSVAAVRSDAGYPLRQSTLTSRSAMQRRACTRQEEYS